LLAQRQPIQKALAFGLATLLVLAPWMLVLVSIAGAPLFNLQAASTIGYHLRPGEHVLGWYRAEYISPLSVLSQHPGLVLAKAVGEARATLPALGDSLQPFALLLALACALALWRRHERRMTLWLLGVLLGSIALQLVIVTTIGYTFSRHYIIFVPIALVFGVDAAVWLAGRPLRRRSAALAATAVALAVLFYPTWQRHYPQISRPVLDDNAARQAPLRALPAGTVVASNNPWLVAWYADVRAIPVPTHPADLDELERRYNLKIGAVFLTTPAFLYDTPPEWATVWNPLRQSCAPIAGFQSAQRTAPGTCLYLRAAAGR
jgi:hypothetical protein